MGGLGVRLKERRDCARSEAQQRLVLCLSHSRALLLRHTRNFWSLVFLSLSLRLRSSFLSGFVRLRDSGTTYSRAANKVVGLDGNRVLQTGALVGCHVLLRL